MSYPLEYGIINAGIVAPLACVAALPLLSSLLRCVVNEARLVLQTSNSATRLMSSKRADASDIS